MEELEAIDNELFIPLSEFLRDDKNISRLEEKILAIDPPDRLIKTRNAHPNKLDDYRGYVLDMYIKLRISEFLEATQCPMSISEFSHREIQEPKLFFVKTDLDYFMFLEKNENGNLKLVTELDGLYLYHGNPSFAVPIILQINFGGRGGGLKSRLKMGLVEQLYSCHPYFCEVRASNKSKNFGLQIRNRDEYQRRIEIPNSPIFNEIAIKLFQAYTG